MQDSAVFADLFNFYLYDGEQVIKPNNLTPFDTTSVVLPYGKDGSTTPIQKYRDILKSATVMADEKTAYLLLGIENQSQMHYAMPPRTMMYDSMQYIIQIDAIGKTHKKNGDKASSAEYLSGLHANDKILPVITLTVYFGADEWTAPTDLHSMLDADKRILKYIDNYHIHLVQPAVMTEDDFLKLTTELSLVFKYIKNSKNKNKLYEMIKKDDTYKSVSKRTADLINIVTGSKLKLKNGEENVDMCKAIEDMRNDAKAEGLAEGLSEGRAEGLAEGAREKALTIAERLIKIGHMALDEIADVTNLSLEEIQSLAAANTI